MRAVLTVVVAVLLISTVVVAVTRLGGADVDDVATEAPAMGPIAPDAADGAAPTRDDAAPTPADVAPAEAEPAPTQADAADDLAPLVVSELTIGGARVGERLGDEAAAQVYAQLITRAATADFPFRTAADPPARLVVDARPTDADEALSVDVRRQVAGLLSGVAARFEESPDLATTTSCPSLRGLVRMSAPTWAADGTADVSATVMTACGDTVQRDYTFAPSLGGGGLALIAAQSASPAA